MSLCHEDQDVRYFANPTLIEPQETQESSSLSRMAMFHNLRQAIAAPDSGFLYSNTFLIRYADEKVNLGHYAQFSALVNTQKL